MSYLVLEHYLGFGEEIYIEFLKDREKKRRAESSLKVITINGGDFLTEDLIIEIFSRLPVKTLLQFKSLCKSWYTIITKPEFVSKHLANYYNNNRALNCFLTLTHSVYPKEDRFCGCFVDQDFEDYILVDLDIIPPFEHELEIDGPCNGIYVLNGGHNRDLRALWNPTIKELKVLPPLVMKPDVPSNLTYCRHFDTYGIGYDALANDYKVVVIKRYTCDLNGYECHCKQAHHPLSVLVYSSRTDSWKYWGDLRQCYDIVEKNVCYIFVNGSFYWIGTNRDGEFEQIIVFDVIVESLQEIQVPNYDKSAKRSLGVYYNSIAFYSVCPILNEDDKYLDIWSLNKGCWTKKVTIGLLAGSWYPLGSLKNKIVLQHDPDMLVLCDPADTSEIWEFHKCVYRNTICIPNSVVVYTESLVSVNNLVSRRYKDFIYDDASLNDFTFFF